MLKPETYDILACPRCKGPLTRRETGLACDSCVLDFPVLDGVPVLVDDSRSLFSVADFVDGRNTTYGDPSRGWKRLVLRAIPSITLNLGSDEHYRTFFATLKERSPNPRILVIGGAVEGAGLDTDSVQGVEMVETDVAFGSRTGLVCDAHDLPFIDGSFDGVIAQAVLEHVLDPFRCVAEMERVLAPEGLIYAETPFMQQVHMGRYDFLRFSHLAHRRLFRRFSEIASGPIGGPGMALAWAWAFFLRSLFQNENLQKAGFAVGSLTGFWLKYLDPLIKDNRGAIDAASAFYFMGRKSDEVLDDRKLIAGYRGAQK